MYKPFFRPKRNLFCKAMRSQRSWSGLEGGSLKPFAAKALAILCIVVGESA